LPYDFAARPLDFVANRYYTHPFGGSELAFVSTVNRLYLHPFQVWVTRTFDRIGVYVQTGQSSTSARLGIYSSTTANVPSALVLDAGTVSTTTNGAKEITISQQLTPGLYWLGIVTQGGTTQPAFTGSDGSTGFGIYGQGFDSILTSGGMSQNYLQASVSGGLPNPFTGTTVSAGQPRLYLRATSS
jgi:hypothetical protein